MSSSSVKGLNEPVAIVGMGEPSSPRLFSKIYSILNSITYIEIQDADGLVVSETPRDYGNS